ncbi:MAG TPA: aspartate carbamoyltransferase [Albitalea sp.]|nr:aspartate carbamoyltransferase [Albitalea sp.]
MSSTRLHFLAVLACLAVGAAATAADAQRQGEVARRGAEGMPFELARTTHVFTKTDHGGTQRVIAKDMADAGQVRLVREHLHEIQVQFRRGDFSGPARIHGADMPGLAELKGAAPGAVSVDYADVAGGAELRFASQDARLVQALHRWFDAQLSDHGHDAVEGHAHHHMSGDMH